MMYTNEQLGVSYEVEPCPFCKHPNIAVRDDEAIYVHCESCMADGPYFNTCSGMTLQECLDGAISQWNAASRLPEIGVVYVESVRSRAERLKREIEALDKKFEAHEITTAEYGEARDAMDTRLEEINIILKDEVQLCGQLYKALVKRRIQNLNARLQEREAQKHGARADH